MEINEILNKKVSFQNNAWSDLTKEYSVFEILDFIKKGKYSYEVNELRKLLYNNEKEKYNDNKKRLPGVTFSATFKDARKQDYIKEYNHILVVDIDKLSEQELFRIKLLLANDQYVFAYWESPSKMGIKGLILLDYENNLDENNIILYHKHAFKRILCYFNDNYKIYLDSSGSDITRLCFLSYDINLILKNEILPFKIVEKSFEIIKNDYKIKIIKNKSKNLNTINPYWLNPVGKNKPIDRDKIGKIIKFLTKKNKSITFDYNHWYRVAYSISNTFSYDLGEKYFLKLCRLDGAKHNEIESSNIIKYCYENTQGNIRFNTIVYLAKEQGYLSEGSLEDG